MVASMTVADLHASREALAARLATLRPHSRAAIECAAELRRVVNDLLRMGV